MTLQRDNPLPVGRYWVSVIGPVPGSGAKDKRKVAEEWFSDRPQVQIITVESHEHVFDDPAWDWYLFEVQSRPLPDWPSAELGFVNRAGPEIKSSQDTVSRPDVPQLSDSVPLPDVVNPTATLDPNRPKTAGGGGLIWALLAWAAYEYFQPKARS